MAAQPPLWDLFLDLPHPSASKRSSTQKAVRVEGTVSEELNQNVPQVVYFCFPQALAPQESSTAQELNRWDVYGIPGFTQFTFSLQLQDGSRVYGHVRRYLPGAYYNVGRRAERALVILTRRSGAGAFYASLLKLLEGIAALQEAGKTVHERPQEWFLQQLLRQEQQAVKVVSGLEFNQSAYNKVDTTRLAWPRHSTSSLLPLLRCVGLVHALRILSALLSERRVIMVSTSATRLAACSNAALSMLEQGLLHWQHLYIPVLPPHLRAYLAAPYPYLIGLLSWPSQTDGLGEVLVIHLDTNQLETRGMTPEQVASRLPDMFVSLPPGAAASNCEMLAQDLEQVLKMDKKILYGESTLQQMGETAAKAGKAVKKTFFKLRDKGRDLLNKNKDSPAAPSSESGGGADEADPDAKPSTPDYIYTESCHNSQSEEEARIAFASFFLCLVGDMRWYLTTDAGNVPRLDRNKLLHQKRQVGEGEGTPMWPLLQNFCQTQMLEEFAKARVHEVGQRLPVGAASPLFTQCAHYHRQNQIDFGLLNVRRVARQVAQSVQASSASDARRMAMTLTSNKIFEGNYGQAVAQLVEDCRECSSALSDVMSVVWLRLRDSRGMQWKHAHLALQILRNLLYHGPLGAIAEATDGLAQIRALKFYDNMRKNLADQVRVAATQVYELLVDRPLLFWIRRVCAERRRTLQDPPPRLQRDGRLRVTSPFKAVHAAMNPRATTGTVVQIPPVSSPMPQAMQRGGPQQYTAQPSQSQYPHQQQYPPAQQPQQYQQPPNRSGGINQDLMGLFGDMSMGNNNVPAAPTSAGSNPYSAASSVSSGSANPFAAPAAITTTQQSFPPQQMPPPQQQQQQQKQQTPPQQVQTLMNQNPFVAPSGPQGYPPAATQPGYQAAPQPGHPQVPQQRATGYPQQPPPSFAQPPNQQQGYR